MAAKNHAAGLIAKADNNINLLFDNYDSETNAAKNLINPEIVKISGQAALEVPNSEELNRIKGVLTPNRTAESNIQKYVDTLLAKVTILRNIIIKSTRYEKGNATK